MKKLKKSIAVFLIISMLFSLALIFTGCSDEEVPKTNAELYRLAVEDAVFADEDEILPLVNVTKDDPMITWNETKDKVLLFTFHRFPSSYPDGQTVSNSWGFVWVCSLKEMQDFYQKNKDSSNDWKLRLLQLMGMPEDSSNTHITAFWVSPEDLDRPAYVADITAPMSNKFAEGLSEEYMQWFKDNTFNSYFSSSFPWTRLGYTYDWADNGTEYGLTEFIIRQGSSIDVEYTVTVEEFLTRLANQ